ncbi:helicase-associated domain-containing protein [Microbacterium radiodurans]|uniref:Helicase XPB/Ssl2 N-terminal domain-containing protein n=1 Tax=Microbacterium radiodurans TaxID=661398 RepID=A0A5J5IQG9_9MICO|nr:helicase-associated domain-containing protein [Microbacterium radiodurans]KAA9085388.1 hypothetical protein F6B42_13045 [Microbacterium radiodurans]
MSPVDARALASWLASADDRVLTDLFAARQVPAAPGWNDFFDAAEALLESASIARGAALLSRDLVAALGDAVATGGSVAAGPERDSLVARAFVRPDGTPYGSVADAWPALTTAATTEAEREPAARPATDAIASASGTENDAQLAERAFAVVAALADVIHATGPAPLARTGAGTLGASDRRRLIELGAADDAETAEQLVAIGAEAELLRSAERDWRVTADGAAWLTRNTVDRWVSIAQHLRDALPPALRGSRGEVLDAGEWERAYPLDPSWAARARGLADRWRAWAIIDAAGRPSGWSTKFVAGGPVDTALLTDLLPGEVDRIFLQNDLTAIAPGPLEPAIDARLRRAAKRESRAQASTYRFSAESIGAALAAGEDAASLTEFLRTISLTGLPQPLAYELERAAARHGRIRVRANADGGTRVEADEPLLDTLRVDQALRPLGLVGETGALVSRSSLDTVFWMLSDARYPVVAVDADGQSRVLRRLRLAAAPEPERPRHDDLVARLRGARGTDDEAAWLVRELEHAVRARAVVVVTVRLPDGAARDFVLEATGLGGGRLRGRDRAADVERTLPVSSISAVRLP